VLVAAGIETVFDLIVASGTDDWYKPIKGIGPKTAQDLLDKLDRLFINGLEHAGGNDD
jgi:5'-3' exonuclease